MGKNYDLDIVKERIIELDNILAIKLSKVNSYNRLTELEKIPFRVIQAERLAMTEFLASSDLSVLLKKCVENESYCASEGIKKAIEWLDNPNK